MESQPFHSARQLGAVLRTARLRRGWSQTELAERADVDRPWLVKLETRRFVEFCMWWSLSGCS